MYWGGVYVLRVWSVGWGCVLRWSLQVLGKVLCAECVVYRLGVCLKAESTGIAEGFICWRSVWGCGLYVGGVQV